jgi:hypothetical protein
MTTQELLYSQLKEKLKSNELSEKEVKIIIDSYKNDFIKFTTYPWFLWLPGFFLLIFSVLLLIFNDKISIVFVNIILFFLSFYIFYKAKIEFVYIKKYEKNIIHIFYNIFGSKVQKDYLFNNVDSIYILKKGIDSRTHQTSKFFIKICLNNSKDKIEYGRTFSFNKAKLKYIISSIFIFGNLSINLTKDKYLIDETKYSDYMIN